MKDEVQTQYESFECGEPIQLGSGSTFGRGHNAIAGMEHQHPHPEIENNNNIANKDSTSRT